MNSRKSGRIVGLLADVATMALGLVLGTGLAWAAGPVVHQRNKVFEPGRVEIARGGSVEFTNEDPFIHHLYIESPGFAYDSGDQRPGRAIKITFDQAGEYVLKCAIHLKMQLEISVK